MLPWLVKKEKVDVFHYLEPYGSTFLNHPTIITTIHDTNLEYTYPYFSRHIFTRIYCEISRFGVIRKTKQFITDCETIKAELKDFLQKRSIKKPIISIFISCDSIFKNFDSKTDKKYFLCLGDFSKRKNIPRVIEAYSKLPKILKDIYNLKIVISTPGPIIVFSKIAKKFDVERYVKFVLNPTTTNLVQLYNHAIAFVYASLYEGFGIPILEAMNCGTPVVTSNFGVTKEVAGEAAILIDPYSVNSISQGMKKLATDKQKRSTLIRLGLLRAKRYSWGKTAGMTLKVYNNI